MVVDKITNVQSDGRGYRLITATVFIVGEVAGGGILSLPHATAQAGWSAIAMIVFCAACAATSGICLSEAWLILEERYPEKYSHTLTRKPFATIGMHTYGKWMSALISILLNITKIGTTTVFLLISADLLHGLTKDFIKLSSCQWTPIVAAALILPMLLGSPADFWPIAYSAMVSTVIGTILMFIGLTQQINEKGISKDFHIESAETFVTAFGTFLFAFGGASAFPNFQNDMKQKDKFTKAVIFGFLGLFALYIPTAGLGYAAFGYEVEDNIVKSMTPGSLVTSIQIFFLIHCLTAVMIIINPVYLDLEELINIPKAFNWKRALFRTSLMAFMTFIGLTFPKFGQILDLIGATSIAMLAIILPPILYSKLCADSCNNIEWPQRRIKPLQKIIFGIIILSGITAGLTSAFSTLKHWSPLSSACYV